MDISPRTAVMVALLVAAASLVTLTSGDECPPVFSRQACRSKPPRNTPPWSCAAGEHVVIHGIHFKGKQRQRAVLMRACCSGDRTHTLDNHCQNVRCSGQVRNACATTQGGKKPDFEVDYCCEPTAVTTSSSESDGISGGLSTGERCQHTQAHTAVTTSSSETDGQSGGLSTAVTTSSSETDGQSGGLSTGVLVSAGVGGVVGVVVITAITTLIISWLCRTRKKPKQTCSHLNTAVYTTKTGSLSFRNDQYIGPEPHKSNVSKTLTPTVSNTGDNTYSELDEAAMVKDGVFSVEEGVYIELIDDTDHNVAKVQGAVPVMASHNEPSETTEVTESEMVDNDVYGK